MDSTDASHAFAHRTLFSFVVLQSTPLPLASCSVTCAAGAVPCRFLDRSRAFCAARPFLRRAQSRRLAFQTRAPSQQGRGLLLGESCCCGLWRRAFLAEPRPGGVPGLPQVLSHNAPGVQLNVQLRLRRRPTHVPCAPDNALARGNAATTHPRYLRRGCPASARVAVFALLQPFHLPLASARGDQQSDLFSPRCRATRIDPAHCQTAHPAKHLSASRCPCWREPVCSAAPPPMRVSAHTTPCRTAPPTALRTALPLLNLAHTQTTELGHRPS